MEGESGFHSLPSVGFNVCPIRNRIVFMETVIIIPARLQSTRLPGKVLYPLCGKPLMHWTYIACNNVTETYIASHDIEVIRYCQTNDLRYITTSDAPKNGSERIAEALEKLHFDIDFAVNVQADEPLIDPNTLNDLLDEMGESPYDIGTLYSKIDNSGDLYSESVVKVVMAEDGKALYFSRLPISDFKHHGIYAYRPHMLLDIVKRQETYLEKREKLEQLRALEYGYHIQCVETKQQLHGVDVYADVEKVEHLLKRK